MFYIEHPPTMMFYVANQYATYAQSFQGYISCMAVYSINY